MCQTEPLYYQQTAARWQTTQRDKPPLIPGELLFTQMCREWQEKKGFLRGEKKTYKIFFFHNLLLYVHALVLPLTVLTRHGMFAVPF